MIDARARQAAYNAASRDQWDGFALHRLQVSTLLGAGRPPSATRLCILGAGNCNDLDLPALLAVHRELHLVDLDPAALRAGTIHQGVDNHPGLTRHAPVDVTSALEFIAEWTPRADVSRAHLEALARWPSDRVAQAVPGPFDHVASVCLLSQLIATAHDALGPEHPGFTAVVRALRAGHLRLLAQLTGARGLATLVTDVVSSEHLPELETAEPARLAAILPQLARSGRHIHGVHPDQLIDTLQTDPRLAKRRLAIESAPPWRWRLHRRDYLVWAVSFRSGA
ncbi:MAG: hypothetical protein U0794_03530 [Isosphaeraceae bacterium]